MVVVSTPQISTKSTLAPHLGDGWTTKRTHTLYHLLFFHKIHLCALPFPAHTPLFALLRQEKQNYFLHSHMHATSATTHSAPENTSGGLGKQGSRAGIQPVGRHKWLLYISNFRIMIGRNWMMLNLWNKHTEHHNRRRWIIPNRSWPTIAWVFVAVIRGRWIIQRNPGGVVVGAAGAGWWWLWVRQRPKFSQITNTHNHSIFLLTTTFSFSHAQTHTMRDIGFTFWNYNFLSGATILYRYNMVIIYRRGE